MTQFTKYRIIWYHLVFLGYSVVMSVTGLENEDNEYCQRETMTIKCRWKSEVIVMTSARWGRMKTHRCLNIHSNFLSVYGQDPMFLGCSEDVISIVDKQCSGRSECDFRIQDQLDTITPCYPDLARYLETGYRCVRVVQESRSCTVVATVEEQYLTTTSPPSSSDGSQTPGCGSRAHPWRIEAPAGQRIIISLLDFTGSASDGATKCRHYGYVIDKMTKRNVSVCEAELSQNQQQQQQTRERDVLISASNSVDIVLAAGLNYSFLIKLSAVGCTNMIPPDNAWLKRSNNDIVIGCYLSQQTWQLKCDGHEWKGQVGTCSDTYSGTVSPVQLKNNSEETLMVKIAMGVIVVAAACVCLLVISVGCFCTKRYSRNSGKKMENPTQLKQDPLLTANCVAVESVQRMSGTNAGFKFSSTQVTNENYSENTDGSKPAKHQTWNQTTPQYFVLDTQQVA